LVKGDIVLENKHLKYVIASDGRNKSFINTINGKDYIEEISPFMEVVKDGSRYPSSAVNMKGDELAISFDPLKIRIILKMRLLDDYLTFELLSTGDVVPDEITMVNLHLSFHDNIGRILNVGYDVEFAACVLALNLQTRSYGASDSRASLMAKCYPRYGVVGSKVAIVSAHPDAIKGIIREVQLNEGLPSPTLGGAWDKESQEVKKSYLFVTLSEQNVDDAIRYAKEGGFSYILDIWATQNYGHYTLDPRSYPNGLDGQKEIVRKIHTAGLKAGLHTLTTCISKADPYATPIPDKRLAKDGSFSLADDLDETSAVVPTEEPPKGVPVEEEKVYYVGGGLDIQIGDEIVTYSGVSLEPPYGFTGCVRGARGTKPVKHRKNATVYHLAQMFGCYLADANTSLLDEVTQHIADVVNECGYDMIYLDGAESAMLQGAWWYYIPKVELAFFEKFKREVLTEGASYTISVYKGQGSKFKISDELIDHFNWHIYSRDAQTDLVSRGVKGHVDRVKLKGVTETRNNLMPAEFGWFGFLTRTPSSQATQPDEIEYVCNKCVGYDSALSIETSVDALKENGWTPEILSIIKNYEGLRLQGYFTEDQKERLRQPGAEFRLTKGHEGRWRLRPVKYLEQYVRAIDGVNNAWSVHDNLKSSSLELRIRSLASMADYDKAENITLVNFEDASPLGSQSTEIGVSCKMEPTSEEGRIGLVGGRLTATSSLDDDSGWCEFEKGVSLDLSSNRGIGFWIRGDGKGEVLNVQLREGGGEIERLCDHYVVVDFEGWRYQEIPEPEGDRIFEYFKHTEDYYTMAAHGFNYSRVTSVILRIMKIPPRGSVDLHLSDIKALREKPLPLRNPSIILGGKGLRFPAELLPDQCLVYRPEDGACQLRSENGFLLKEVDGQGEAIALEPGINDIVFNCDTSAGLAHNAKVRLAILEDE
jgi:hypothetical protein